MVQWHTGGDANVAGGDTGDGESDGDGYDSDGASALFGWGASDAVAELPADLDERQPGDDEPATWRVHLPSVDDMLEWSSHLYDSVESAEHARPLVWKVPAKDGDGMRWPSIHDANARQRDLLTDVVLRPDDPEH